MMLCESWCEIFSRNTENTMARIPKILQLGTQMAANLEMLEKWILAVPQRDLTTTGLGEKFYSLCVQTMGQKWERMGNIEIPETDRFVDKGHTKKQFEKIFIYVYISRMGPE